MDVAKVVDVSGCFLVWSQGLIDHDVDECLAIGELLLIVGEAGDASDLAAEVFEGLCAGPAWERGEEVVGLEDVLDGVDGFQVRTELEEDGDGVVCGFHVVVGMDGRGGDQLLQGFEGPAVDGDSRCCTKAQVGECQFFEVG